MALVFLFNVPFSVAVLVVRRRHVPEPPTHSSGRIDILGAAWAVIALSTLTYG